MKFTLLTAGSRGDVQPFIALAVELKNLGQDVTVVAGENFQDLVEGYDIDYSKIRVDVSKIIASGAVNDAVKADSPLKVIRNLRRKDMMRKMRDIQEDYYNTCQDCDVIVYHPGAAAIATGVSRSRGIPAILASPFPMIKTNEYPSLIFYKKRPPRIFNALTHEVFLSGFWMATKKPAELYLKKNLKQSIRIKNPLKSDALKLIACSDHIFRTEKGGYASGFWFLDEKESYQPDESLKEFIESGAKPVYIGFGSIGNTGNAANITAAIVEALDKVGMRAVLATGYGALNEKDDFPNTIKVIKSVSHSWLFPKMAGI